MRRILALALLLLALAPAAALAAGEELLQNGDFAGFGDGVTPDGWSYAAWETQEGFTEIRIEPDAYAGGNAVSIENIAPNDARLEQTVPVTPGALYRISVMARAERCDNEAVGANISVADSLALSTQAFDTGGEWEELVLWGRAGSKQKSLTVMVRLGGYGSLTTGHAWFADARVNEVSVVPEDAVVQDLGPAPKGNPNNDGDVYSVNSAAQLLLVAAAFLVFAFALQQRMGRATLPGTPNEEKNVPLWLLCGLGAAALLRFVMAYRVPGYPTDMSCWRAWGGGLLAYGPAQFYQSVEFCDYPPGYIYILGLLSGLRGLLGLGEGMGYETLLKTPAILADIATAYLLYRWMKRAGASASCSMMLALLYAFSPAIFSNSAAFGQIDSVFTLLLLLCIDRLMQRKMLAASLIYAAAVLIKPQSLMLGTVLLAAFLTLIAENPKKGLMELARCVSLAVVALLIAILPFSLYQKPDWILVKYFGTLASYPYATVNSYNLFALLGGNWVSQTEPLFIFSWATWGGVLMAGVFGYMLALWAKARDRWAALPLLGAVFVAGVFVLGVRMHERYLFPALALLLFTCVRLRDKRLCYLFAGFSVTQYVNVMLVLKNTHLLQSDFWLTAMLSAVNVALVIALFYVAWRVLVRGEIVGFGSEAKFAEDGSDEGLEQDETSGDAETLIEGCESLTEGGEATETTMRLPTLDRPGTGPEPLRRVDWAIMLGITAVYAVLALVNLGDTRAPVTYWQSTGLNESVLVDFGERRDVARMQYYGGISHGDFTLEIGDDPAFAPENTTMEPITAAYPVNEMFKWRRVEANETGRYARLTFPTPGLRLHELSFWDYEGNLLPIAAVTDVGGRGDAYDPANLADEQDVAPATPSYRNSMYFDEIYHARTAYEHIHLMPWYETTHPPLGKVFISWAIMIFGMNPFGWRFAGALFGILMVPAMYLLARRVFKRRWITVSVTLLMTFDLMHFGQTRLATIDSFVVLFIMLMYLCMFAYMARSFHHEPLGKTLVPLGLSGLFMGLGIASKWTGAYAGLGLAALFFITLGKRILEAREADRRLKLYTSEALELDEDERERLARIVEQTPRHVAITLGACVVFFILVPVVTYVASYYQYIQQGHGLYDIWRAQIDMFDYHSSLTEGHGFASPWYEWPLMIRPMWYYMGEHLPAGTVASLNGMGNPLVWWPGFAAAVWALARQVRRKAEPFIAPILIALGAQFLPWVLVTRATFIYHYFTSVPFVILLLGFALDARLSRNPLRGKRELVIYLAAAVAVFALFFPMVSGITVPIEYARLLRWIPSWSLFWGS